MCARMIDEEAGAQLCSRFCIVSPIAFAVFSWYVNKFFVYSYQALIQPFTRFHRTIRQNQLRRHHHLKQAHQKRKFWDRLRCQSHSKSSVLGFVSDCMLCMWGRSLKLEGSHMTVNSCMRYRLLRWTQKQQLLQRRKWNLSCLGDGMIGS